MPDLDGIEVMAPDPRAPAGAGHPADGKGSPRQGEGLDLGADDYIAKPFHRRAGARVRAVLRARPEPAGGGRAPVRRRGDRLERRMVTRAGESSALAHRVGDAPAPRIQPGAVVLHSELLTKVWGPSTATTCSTCGSGCRASAASSARSRRAGPDRTFQGIGYLLDVEEASGRAGRRPARGGAAAPRPRT